MASPSNHGSSARDRWEQRRRRQQEWARLTPEQKDSILQALYGCGSRPPLTQLQMRLEQEETRP